MFEQMVQDIKTYQVLLHNDNYRKRLFEIYGYLKKEGINSLEEFESRNDISIGGFTYNEVSIFDRIVDINYAHKLSRAYYMITAGVESYINNPNIGDQLVDNAYFTDNSTKIETDKPFSL